MQLRDISRRQMLKIVGIGSVLGFFVPMFHSSVSCATEKTGKKALVVYFSVPETNDPHNMTRDEDNSVVVINGKVLGNTQYVAQVIQNHTGADVFRLESVDPYPMNHRELLRRGQTEHREGARPAIAGNIPELKDYDIIFLGYPNWYDDMPMILYTFLEQCDLSGKTIIPFNTHGGSGFSNTIQTIADLQPRANINRNGFTVSRNMVEDSEPDIVSWLRGLDL